MILILTLSIEYEAGLIDKSEKCPQRFNVGLIEKNFPNNSTFSFELVTKSLLVIMSGENVLERLRNI